MNYIVVPVRNGIALTKAAMPTLLAQDIENVHVIVINNASTDGTTEWLDSLWPQVTGLYQGTPLSVAASWNLGMRVCKDAPYVLVVNNDVELRPDTYRLLVEHGGPFVTGVGVGDRRQMTTADAAAERPHPDFSCFLIRQHAYKTVGPFDERVKGAYCEDSLWHVAAHRKGVKCVCIDVPFYHVASGTIKHASEAEKEAIQQRADANREYFKAKWGVEIGTEDYNKLFSKETFGVDA